METFNNTRELLENWPTLDNDVREALLSAVSSQGKWKGFVLANAPATKQRKRYAAWQALMGALAPVRMSVGGLMFMSAEDKALFDRMSAALDGPLGQVLQAQEPAFRWSLFAHRHDVDTIRAIGFKFCCMRSLELAGQQRLFA